jgi:hypothetical protein
MPTEVYGIDQVGRRRPLIFGIDIAPAPQQHAQRQGSALMGDGDPRTHCCGLIIFRCSDSFRRRQTCRS